MIRIMCSDVKNEFGNSKIFDDDYYVARLTGNGLNPFEEYSATNDLTLKRIRIDVMLDIAANEELVRRIQESITEHGEWDIHRYIKHLRFDLSQFKDELFS